MKGIDTHALTKKLPKRPVRFPIVEYVTNIVNAIKLRTKQVKLVNKAEINPTPIRITAKARASEGFIVPLGMGRSGSLIISISLS